MEQCHTPESRPKTLWNRLRQWVLALPFKAQIVLAVFLCAALLLAMRTAFSSKDSSLHLRLQHGFRSGQLTVLIDGHKVYSGKLTGYSKKKYGLFGDTVEGSLSQVFPVRSGIHQVLVRVEPGDGTIQEDSITGVFAAKVERNLAVSARRSGLALSWQGESAAAPSSVSAVPEENQSWLSRYAGSLFLTIAGSVVSALTGLAIRELPTYLRSRQESAKSPSEITTQS